MNIYDTLSFLKYVSITYNIEYDIVEIIYSQSLNISEFYAKLEEFLIHLNTGEINDYKRYLFTDE